MKKNVLILTGYYTPSVKGGGPIQSIKNLVDNLSEQINFFIVTSDRDLGDEEPFKNTSVDKWIKVGNANVYYTNKQLLNWKKLKKIINSIDYDAVYLNSFFSYKLSIMPIFLNKVGIIASKPVILAPRGEFSGGALSLKSFKKMLYIKMSKLLGLYNRITWHATTDLEKSDIKKMFGDKSSIKTAKNLTPNYKNKHYDKSITKKPRELKLIYVARIHPMKNLLQALEILNEFEEKIEFNIYGPIEDKNYWEKCKKIISSMRNNVTIKYHGLISNDKVNDIYKKNHVSILLTLGENFGHSISEALIGGCPVIISNRTPWQDIDKYNSGWDLPLENKELIVEKIRCCINLDNVQYQKMSKSAFELGKSRSNQLEDFNSYINMLMV